MTHAPLLVTLGVGLLVAALASMLLRETACLMHVSPRTQRVAGVLAAGLGFLACACIIARFVLVLRR